jgi:hypothetical protein
MVDLSKLKGLGGWLILVGLGLCLSPFSWLSSLSQDDHLIRNGPGNRLSDPAISLHPAVYPAHLKFELVGNVVLLAANVCLLYLFFMERRAFPRYYVLFLFAFMIFTALDYAIGFYTYWTASGALKQELDEVLSGQEFGVARAALTAIIWGLYITKSKRVKATFVN